MIRTLPSNGECNPRGSAAPALIGADGVAINTNILEHLDLAIDLIDGKLMKDVHQKDTPIYNSTRSCHPPATFTSVAKSVAMALVMNCSLKRSLSPRIEEYVYWYTRYLMASGYSRRDVEEARQLDRVKLIRSPPRPEHQVENFHWLEDGIPGGQTSRRASSSWRASSTSLSKRLHHPSLQERPQFWGNNSSQS